MRLIILLINLSIINCNLNINETANKIKNILNDYRNIHKRCSKNLDQFVSSTLDVIDKTVSFGDYLKVYNVTQCHSDDDDDDYVEHHILDGLIIHHQVPESHWHEYRSVHNKKYLSYHHEMAALSTWKRNLRQVAEHNRRYLSGELSYSLHLNFLGDLSPISYIGKFLKLITTFPLPDPAHDHRRMALHQHAHRQIPRHVDWRTKGFKPRLEQQYECGSCYAFAVAHALQAQLYRKHGDWRELSTQQIVDCSQRDGNLGCDGGSLQAALRYAARAGLIAEKNYPYRGRKGPCKYHPLLVKARPRRWATLPAGDEDAMERALATIGPLAVAVNAAPFTFQLYRSGIYDDPFCLPWQLNHAMLLVGYTPRYWLLLNWWGRHWGEGGYIRIRRGFNRCGVANMATYVEL